MRVIITLLAYIFYAYIAINMIIDIEDFGDFVWFVFIGSILLAILQFVLGFIVALFWGDER